MISGVVEIDITNVEPERARRRFASLSGLPGGVTVEVHVGPLAANPEIARVLADQANRLHIIVKGEPYAVPRWLELVKNPDVLGWT